MARIVLIPKAALEAFPPPRSANLIAAARIALAAGQNPSLASTKGPYSSISVPDDLYAALNTGRGSVVRYLAGVAAADGGGGLAPEPTVTYERLNTAPPPPPPPAQALTTAQRRIAEARASRVRTAIEDAEDGKWARIIFTAGHRSVDQWVEDGDYVDEIDLGLVFRTAVPMGMSPEDAAAWVETRQQMPRMHWWYLDGDSETITNARDAKLRAEILAAGGEAAENVALVEQGEKIQVRLFGRKSIFLELAAQDVKMLGDAAHPSIKAIAGLGSKKLLAK